MVIFTAVCSQKLINMKKIQLLVLGFVFVANGLFAGNYTLNNQAIDNLFDEAVETVISNTNMLVDNDFASTNTMSFTSGDTTTTVLVAWIVNYFVGFFGIHRYVLGTKSSMWALYTFTCGGIFGVVVVVDWVVLLIDGLILQNGEKYIDNENFFMWM